MWHRVIVLGLMGFGGAASAVQAQETAVRQDPAAPPTPTHSASKDPQEQSQQATPTRSASKDPQGAEDQPDPEAAHRSTVAKGLAWLAAQQCTSCHDDPHGKDVALAGTWLSKQECVRCHFTVKGQQGHREPEAAGDSAARFLQRALADDQDRTLSQLALLQLGQCAAAPGTCTRNAARKNTVTYLGVGVSPVPGLLRRHLKLPAEMGLLVETVDAESPAQAAGVEQYDVLEEIDEQWLVNQEQFSALVRHYRPGTRVAIALVRANERQTLAATLAEREVPDGDAARNQPPTSQCAAIADVDNDGDGYLDLFVTGQNQRDARTMALFYERRQTLAAREQNATPATVTYLGVQTSSPPAALAHQLKLPQGLFLLVDGVDEGSPAAAAGVRSGDVLKQLDDQLLANAEQLGVLVRAHQAGDEVALTLIREGEETTLQVKLAQRDVPAAKPAASTFEDARVWAVEGNRLHFVDLTAEVPMVGDTDREFIRRVYLDQGGMLPAEDEIRRFLDDSRPDKRERLVEELSRKLQGVDSSLEWSDAEHSLRLTSRESKPVHLVVKDASGNVVFDGPVDTDERRAVLSKDLAAKLELVLWALDRQSRQGQAGAQSPLERVISITATEASLKQVVDMLRKQTGANIVVNAKALKAAGADLEAPLTFELHDVKLATALKTIGLLVDGSRKTVGYTLEEGVILISAIAPE